MTICKTTLVCLSCTSFNMIYYSWYESGDESDFGVDDYDEEEDD